MKRPVRACPVITVLAAAAACALGPTHAVAKQPPAPATCNLSSPTAMSFGTYDPIAGAAVDGTSSISYRCPAKVQIWLSAGASGSFTARTMTQGGEVLRYNLYLDANRTQIWGDGSGATGVGPVAPTTADGTDTVYVYGRILAAQDPVAGVYADVVEVTFNL